jgi:hypothetical protein
MCRRFVLPLYDVSLACLCFPAGMHAAVEECGKFIQGRDAAELCKQEVLDEGVARMTQAFLREWENTDLSTAPAHSTLTRRLKLEAAVGIKVRLRRYSVLASDWAPLTVPFPIPISALERVPGCRRLRGGTSLDVLR